MGDERGRNPIIYMTWPINRAATCQGFHFTVGSEIGGATSGCTWDSTFLNTQDASKTLLAAAVHSPFLGHRSLRFFFSFFAAPCCDFSAGCSAALRSGFVPLNGAVVDGRLWKDHVQSACLRMACATSREIIYMFVEVPDWNAPCTNMMFIISIRIVLHQPFSVGSNFPHVLEISIWIGFYSPVLLFETHIFVKGLGPSLMV